MSVKIPGYKPEAIELFRCQTTDEFAALLHFLAGVSFNGKADIVGLDVMGRGYLFFENGRVVHAQEGAVTGIEAVAHMLVWEQTEIHLLRRVVAPCHEFTCTTDNLIMDATLLADQNAALWRVQTRDMKEIPEPALRKSQEEKTPENFLTRKIAPIWLAVPALFLIFIGSCQFLNPFSKDTVTIGRKAPAPARFSETLQAGKKHTIPGLNIKMLAVPSGIYRRSFVSPTGKKMIAVSDILPFWMAAGEVTQADFEKLTGVNPSFFKGEKLPVETLTWNQAREFCELLTGIERALGRIPADWEYRLPTELEWEYACVADQKVIPEELAKLGWYQDNSGKTTRETMQKKANPWGFYDMLGNVNEWCLDWLGYVPFEKGQTADKKLPLKACRGGSWRQAAEYCSPLKRIPIQRENATNIVGFRPVLAPVGLRSEIEWEQP